MLDARDRSRWTGKPGDRSPVRRANPNHKTSCHVCAEICAFRNRHTNTSICCLACFSIAPRLLPVLAQPQTCCTQATSASRIGNLFTRLHLARGWYDFDEPPSVFSFLLILGLVSFLVGLIFAQDQCHYAVKYNRGVVGGGERMSSSDGSGGSSHPQSTVSGRRQKLVGCWRTVSEEQGWASNEGRGRSGGVPRFGATVFPGKCDAMFSAPSRRM